MKDLITISEQLNRGGDIDAMRIDIMDLIAYHLQHGKETNNLAALPHLINAVGSLTLNIHSQSLVRTVGLFTCLADIERAAGALYGCADFNRVGAQGSDAITYDFLISSLESMRRFVLTQNSNAFMMPSRPQSGNVVRS